MKKHKNASAELARADITGARIKTSFAPGSAKTYRGYITSFGVAPEVDVPLVGKGAAVEVYIPKWQ